MFQREFLYVSFCLGLPNAPPITSFRVRFKPTATLVQLYPLAAGGLQPALERATPQREAPHERRAGALLAEDGASEVLPGGAMRSFGRVG